MAPAKRKQQVKSRKLAAPKRPRRTASSSTSSRKAAKSKSRSRTKAKPAAPFAPGGASPEDLFTKGLIVRGEAVPVDESGKLPNQATHVLETDDSGEVTVRRERFKLY
jgi:hypothetical protein